MASLLLGGTVLEALGPVAAGNPEALNALRKRFDRLQVQDAAAQNRLFELEIAGRLARNGVSVEFAEPDIVATARNIGRFSLACKRPQNIDRMRERIDSGAKQVRDGGRRGFVVIDLQPWIFKGENEGPTKFYELHDGVIFARRSNATRMVESPWFPVPGSARPPVSSDFAISCSRGRTSSGRR